MKAPLALAVLSAVALLGALRAAEPSAPAPTPTPAPAQTPGAVTEAMIRARQAERIKAKTSTKPAQAATPAPAKSETGAPAHLAAPTAAELAQSKTETPEVLPKVEVRRTRATEIELEVFKQEKEIAREKAKIKSTDTDRALNGSSGKALSIFGGQTTTQRETVAKERVSLMESERDLMEAIAYAKTKEEKDALRKELNEIKALRRDLESALR
jgi:hypothetical protein